MRDYRLKGERLMDIDRLKKKIDGHRKRDCDKKRNGHRPTQRDGDRHRGIDIDRQTECLIDID
jgi:hypothetical protein